jgi:Ca-activated chloride channel homolog
MTWEKNPYAILGVPTDATSDQIKSAYRKLARRLHPDVNPDNRAAEQHFQDITQANEILSSTTRRRQYDESQARKANDSQYYFTVQPAISKRNVTPLQEPQVVYMLVDVFADPRAQEEVEKHEARLNLCLVLDQSNSMSGTRIEKVKIAAHQIIENLSPNDFISVVTFNDRAEVIIEATPVKDKASLKAKVSLIAASGGTEIYQGLKEGVSQVRQYLGNKLVNHVILLTDGHTYGDQNEALQLADSSAQDGIGISAMGLGHDWNDRFLDDIASRTGGNSSYINSAAAVVRFLNDHVRSLVNAFADRMMMHVAVDPDVVLESAFKLAPNPQPIVADSGVIPLGGLQATRPMSILLQLQLPANMSVGERAIARVGVQGDILSNDSNLFHEVQDMQLNVTTESIRDEPPSAILEALSKLTLYKLQERAQEAADSGDISEATRRLENLATRLLALGQEQLASRALSEARRVTQTHELSDRGRKTLKYQTRHLLQSFIDEDDEESTTTR